MAFELTGLVNNIKNSIDGLVSDLTGKPNTKGEPFYFKGETEFRSIQSQINTENWMKLSFPYTFSVIDLRNPSAPSGEFTDFALPLAPQKINQTEEFAISIVPTQGGTTVTHSGNKYKTLNIEGTTGIAPFRGGGGVNQKTGEGIFQPKQLKYKSGYEVFLHLRNWFRTYYEFKKKRPDSGRNMRLVFKNYKDGEFLIVELMKFEMDRQSSRSFLYDYKLEFKVLSHLEFQKMSTTNLLFEDAVNDALNLLNTSRGVFLRSQEILRQIESTYEAGIIEPLRQATLAIKALQGVGLVAADIGNRAIKNTVRAADALAITLGIKSQQDDNRVSGGLDVRLANINLPSDIEAYVAQKGSSVISEFGEGLMAIDVSEFPDTTISDALEEQTAAQQLPRTFYEDTITTLERVRQNAEDFFNLGSSEYDSIFGRTSTLSADETKVVSQEEYDLLNAFNESVMAIHLVLSTNDLFKSSFDERIQDMISRFNGNISLFASPAVRQVKYSQGDTLERIAQRELGNSERWGEIVELNGLKSPYVSDKQDDPRKNIIRPGEVILIPAKVRSGFSQVPDAKEIRTTKNLNQIEKSLGTDFKLTRDNDLSLTASGDFELVSGADNMAQGTILKLSYEPGEVIGYPEMGAGIQVGKKFPDLNDIHNAVVNTLLQDNRVQRVDDLQLTRENSGLNLRFNLKIKEVDIPVPVTIKLA